MDTHEIIEKINKLYQQLIEEEKGSYTYNYMYTLPPNGLSYYNTAKELFAYAIKLSEINDMYQIYELAHTMGKEVEFVRDFKYEYDNDAKMPKTSSINKMVHLMKDATGHIYRDFIAMLK